MQHVLLHDTEESFVLHKTTSSDKIHHALMMYSVVPWRTPFTLCYWAFDTLSYELLVPFWWKKSIYSYLFIHYYHVYSTVSAILLHVHRNTAPNFNYEHVHEDSVHTIYSSTTTCKYLKNTVFTEIKLQILILLIGLYRNLQSQFIRTCSSTFFLYCPISVRVTVQDFMCSFKAAISSCSLRFFLSNHFTFLSSASRAKTLSDICCLSVSISVKES